MPSEVLAESIGLHCKTLNKVLAAIGVERSRSGRVGKVKPKLWEEYKRLYPEMLRLYSVELMGSGDIAKRLGIPKSRVLEWLKMNSITLRDRSEAIKSQWIHAPIARREMTSALMREQIGPLATAARIGTKNPQASARMKRSNPVHMPGVARRILQSKRAKGSDFMRAIARKGVETRTARGITFAGEQNPAYGKSYPPGPNYRFRGGVRSEIHPTAHFRSAWEANFARFLNHLGVPWEYEVKAFPLPGGVTYRPDFYLPSQNLWVEVKGQMREKARRKIELFREAYPGTKLVIFDKPKHDRILQFFGTSIQFE